MTDKPEAQRQSSRRTFLKTAGAGAAAMLPQRSRLGASEAGFPDLTQMQSSHERQGLVPPEKTYRMMEWGLHLPPQAKFDFDVEGAMKATRATGTESVMFYAQDHWGYARYPSDVGIRHPNLTSDFFGGQVELARKYGMSAVAYFSLQANNQIILKNPDWCCRDEKGEQIHGRWFTPCLDSPYRQYAVGMMGEIAEHYEVDELFIDIFGIQFVRFYTQGTDPFCYCHYTEEAWNRDFPGDDYREGFKTQEGWEKRFRWHQQRCMVSMLDEIIAAARRHRSNLKIALNGGPEVFSDEIQRRLSFMYSEPLPSATGIALGSILLRGWGRPDYQAGIFTMWPYLDELPETPLRVQTDALLLQNSRVFFVGESPLIRDSENMSYSVRWFDRAREAFADVRNVDGLLAGAQPLLSTAALFSPSTMDDLTLQRRPVEFRQSILGAVEILTYTGRPVESLPDFRLATQLDKFDTLILPEVECLSDADAARIAHWVGKGGTLIASHRCALRDEQRRARADFALAEVLGVNFDREELKYAYDENGKTRPATITTYLESTGHPLGDMLGTKTVGLPGSFIHVRPQTAETILRFRLASMVEDVSHYQYYNFGPPPPGTETAGPAVTLNKFGKGQALYVGAPIFRAMRDRPFWVRKWLPSLVRQLVPDPAVELRLDPVSEFTHGTFFRDKSGRFVIVQILNTIELTTQGELLPAPALSVVVNPEKLKIAAARMVYPRTEDLPVNLQGDRTHIALPKLDRYCVVMLKLS